MKEVSGAASGRACLRPPGLSGEKWRNGMPEQTKSAFVAIVGRPNVGKSSLLNAMVGRKVAIVSDKPQTTRTRIMGVLTREETQLVFLDTPGNHPYHN